MFKKHPPKRSFGDASFDLHVYSRQSITDMQVNYSTIQPAYVPRLEPVLCG